MSEHFLTDLLSKEVLLTFEHYLNYSDSEALERKQETLLLKHETQTYLLWYDYSLYDF